ncbi:MAG: hypothetical protein HY055_02425 [Magnetospirillum sp.]|nr:hypothetical protein [Magnetospirillum sp.]
MAADGLIPTFVLMGNHKYYRMLELNIDCIRRVYPTAPVIVYDWGGADYRPGFTRPEDGLVRVVDWGGAIKDTENLESSLRPAQKVDLAIRYNARFPRTLGQRIKKKILKSLPNSPLARPLIKDGLVFENMLAQKIPCMVDASGRVGAGAMVFLDADAFLLRPLDGVLGRGDFDVAVTLIERPCFEVNRCAVINSGVIFYGPDPAGRDAFLTAWLEACGRCDEWLKEQTSMVRMLEASGAPAFTAEALNRVELAGRSVAVLSLAQRLYNNTDHECLRAGEVPCVAHFANTANNDSYFDGLRRQLLQAAETLAGG